MRKTIIALLLAATVAYANPPAPFPVVVDSQSRSVPSLEIYQAEARTFRVMFRDNGAGSNVSGVSPYLWWATDASATQFVTSVWARVNGGTTGCVDFTFSAASVNTNGDLIYGVGAGATYRQGALRIIANPYTAGVAAPVFSTNSNLAGVSFSNYPWPDGASFSEGATNGAAIVGNTIHVSFKTNYADSGSGTSGVYTVQSTNSRVTVTGGTGPTVSLGFDATGLATGSPIYSLAGVATGTPIYAETSVTSGVAQGQTANLSITGTARSLYFTLSGLATGTPVYSLSGVATGAPVYVELDATALAQLATASNSLRLGIGLVSSNLTTETANSIAASNALQSSIGLVNTNSLARDAGISNTIAALGGTYLTRGSNLSDVASAATARSNLGLGTAATNDHASAVWNADSIQGVAASTQRVALSLFSSGTGNSAAFRSVGGALAPPSMTTTQIVFAIAQGAVGDSNLNSSVSNAFQTSASAATNNARVLALETGRAHEVSYRVTSAQVANVAGDYVSRTSRTAQSIASDVTVYGGATVYSNLYVHTDALSSELLSNGDFATDTAWVKGGSIYHDSGRYVVNDGLSGSLTPSGTVSVSAGRLYRVAYTLNGSATGAVTVTLGGATNAYDYALSGTAVTNVIKLAANNTVAPSLAFGTTAGQVNVDDFTVKGYTAGNLAADRVYAGTVIGNIAETSRFFDVVARGASVTSVTIEVASNAIIARASTISNDSQHAAILGGVGHTIAGGSQMSFIAGGGSNRIGAGTLYATIAGGSRNVIAGDSTDSSIAGGTDGYIGSGTGGAGIWGGNFCTIGEASDYAVVVGGESNRVYGNSSYSIVAGGYGNRIMTTSTNVVSGFDDSLVSTIVGGELNIVSGDYSVVIGGYSNEVAADYAWAAGYQSRAAHQGAWVLSDSQTGGFASTNADSFNLRFQGGLRFVDGTNVLIVNNGAATLNGVSMTQAGSVTALTEFASQTATAVPARVALYSGGVLATSTTSGAEMSLYLAGAVQTGGVITAAGLQGDITLTAGSGITITTNGQDLAFASSGGSSFAPGTWAAPVTSDQYGAWGFRSPTNIQRSAAQAYTNWGLRLNDVSFQSLAGNAAYRYTPISTYWLTNDTAFPPAYSEVRLDNGTVAGYPVAVDGAFSPQAYSRGMRYWSSFSRMAGLGTIGSVAQGSGATWVTVTNAPTGTYDMMPILHSSTWGSLFEIESLGVGVPMGTAATGSNWFQIINQPGVALSHGTYIHRGGMGANFSVGALGTWTNRVYVNGTSGWVSVGCGAVYPNSMLHLGSPITMQNWTGAPPTAYTSGVMLWPTNGELQVMDASGNTTQLSPHDGDRWVFRSANMYTGKRIEIDMETLAEELQRLSGRPIISVTYERPSKTWEQAQDERIAQARAARDHYDRVRADAEDAMLRGDGPADGIPPLRDRPTIPPREPEPAWITAATSRVARVQR